MEASRSGAITTTAQHVACKAVTSTPHGVLCGVNGGTHAVMRLGPSTVLYDPYQVTAVQQWQ
jgi:hypothetical protein